MSDHNWVLENLESYSAGGLNAEERERLEAHLPECSSCSQALQEIRASDQQLETLFAPVRPKPGFEDRMISSLRTASTKNGFRMPMIGWIGASAAAAVVVGVVGATMQGIVMHGSLLPGGSRVSAGNDLKQIGSDLHAFHGQVDFDSETSEEKLSKITGPKNASWISALLAHQEGSRAGSFGGGGFGGNGGGGSFGGNFAGGQGGEGRQGEAVDKMAEALSERHISELGRREVAFSSDGRNIASGGVKLWDADTGKANASMGTDAGRYAGGMAGMMRMPGGGRGGPGGGRDSKPESAASEKNAPAAGVPLGDAKAAVPESAEAKVPGLGYESAPAPAQIYTHRTDQQLATPPPPPGWGYSLGGMGGGAGKPSPAGGVAEMSSPDGGGGGPVGANPNNIYFRPGEQMAGLGMIKDDTAYKSEAKPQEPAPASAPAYQGVLIKKPANPQAGKVNINNIDDPTLLGALQDKKEDKKENQGTPPAAMRKIIIRTGEIEFEIDSFDSAVATVTLLVNKLPGAFVATVNSEKLPNGKVRGSMVVRTPPEHLDTLVLDLRKELGKNGELKGQKIGSQDITKQYTDTESRLKAARAMESRLLEIIKSGKGEIKDLLAAEKELGIWRTKIEEYEGEKRYYDNQVALSTLTITLAEKEIRSPFALIETERVQMGVEVEDVIKAQQQVLKAVDDAKGRVTKSELKQHAADQLSATINFEVAPDKAGPMRDRIEQLGRRTRLDVDRLQETEGGTGEPSGVSRRVLPEIKTHRKDTQFFLNLYNVANVAPRETVNLNLACLDTEDAYKKILARVEKATGRIVTSNLNRQRNDQTTGQVQFEVKSADAEAVLLDVRELGEVMRLQTTENPDVQNTTRSKRGFIVQLFALGTVAPRETATIHLASKDVPAGYRSLLDAINKAKGRVLNSQLNEQDKQNITANLDFEIRRADETAISKAMTDVGDTYSRAVARAQDSDTVVDSKVRYTVTLINQARIPPRETVTLGIEVNDVDKTAEAMNKQAADVKGRTVESHVARERSGRMTAKLIYDVPLASAPDLVDKFSRAGIVRVQQFTKNQQVPESDLAIARLDVTLSNSPLIVPSDEGFGPELRKGLATSVRVLSLSLSWLVFGLLVLLPWALVVYAIYRLVVRLRGKPSAAGA